MKKIILSSIFVLIIDYSFGQTNTFPASGNVGIGTTSPTKKLDILGSGINLENTTHNGQYGIVYKNGYPFISNFNYGDNGTVTTSGNNTFVGYNAGNLTMGSTATTASEASYNTIVGNSAFMYNTTGYQNTVMGYAGIKQNTSGANNASFGYEGLFQNTTGSDNTAIGFSALFNNTTGYYNVAIGYKSLYYNSAKNANVALGFRSGVYTADGSSANTGSSNSVFIGADTKSYTSVSSNEIVIGYNAVGAGSNSVVLGNPSVTKTLLQGNVGIGTSDPQSKLAANGTVTAKQVKVTQAGWPDYVFDSAYKLPALEEIKAFIDTYKRLPGIQSAEIVSKEGLDLGDMQQKQMQKIEEMMLYLIEQNRTIQSQQLEIESLKDQMKSFKANH